MAIPYLISLPHCSAMIPRDLAFRFALNKADILESEDFGTREIFGILSAPVLQAEISRLVVDLNRHPDNKSAKGIVAKTDYNGNRIYKPGKHPDPEAVDQLIDKYYRPYHEKLDKAFARPEIKVLFDCHSLREIAPKDAPDAGSRRKDIILSNNGDVNGDADPGRGGSVSCSRDRIRFVRSVFESFGFSVSINHPYRGGFITVHYGQKYPDKDVIQIELNQGLYMNPAGTALDQARIKKVQQIFISVFKIFSDYYG